MNESIRHILENSIYMTIATIAENGAPWNVPLRFAFDDAYIYFRSPANTAHGSYIAKDGRVSAVVLDTSQEVKGAVYIQSVAAKLAGEDETLAIDVYNKRFNTPPQQWDKTEYYSFKIGIIDPKRSKGEMYYFDNSLTA